MVVSEKRCEHCGLSFSANKSQKYCSLRCAVWSRIDVRGNDECWPWIGSVGAYGYGIFRFSGKSYRANRAVLEAAGVDLSGLNSLHSCDNPICCNPNHLSAGTHTQNMQEMLMRGRRNTRLEKAPRASLTNAQVLEIKKLIGSVRQVEIAKMFNVKRTVIADISAGRSWKGV